MKKDMIILAVRIILSIVALACFAVCIAQQDKNQVLLSAGFVLTTIAFLLSLVSRKNEKIISTIRTTFNVVVWVVNTFYCINSDL